MRSAPSCAIHILPHVPSSACGVADYAWSLAKRLREDEQVESIFIGVQNAEGGEGHATVAFPAEVLPSPSSAALLEVIERHREDAACLILHFSPYGYQKRGVALWLAEAWKQLSSNLRIPRRIVMFHEVAASSSPLQSAFWLRPLQHRVARSLLFNSDFVMTNCELNRREIQRSSRSVNANVPILPVFSNFGEPSELRSFSARERQIILFTSNLASQHGIKDIWSELQNAVVQAGAQRIVMIGKSVVIPSEFSVPVYQTGFLTMEQVSQMLAESAFGFAFVGPQLFAKSGIFAAFAAHGVIPLVPVPDATLWDGLRAGEHYVRPVKMSDLSDPEAIQRSLQCWYSGHSQRATARFFAQQILIPSIE